MPFAPTDFEALHTAEMFVRECYPKTRRMDEHRAAALFVIRSMRIYGLSAGTVAHTAYVELEMPGWGHKRLSKLVGRFAEWMHAQGDMSDDELAHVRRDVAEHLAPAPGTIGAFRGGVRDVVLRPANPSGEERTLTPPKGQPLKGFLATIRNPHQRGMARNALEYATALFCLCILDNDTPCWEHFRAATFLDVALDMRPADLPSEKPEDFDLEEGALRWLAVYLPWLAKRDRVAPDVADRIRRECLQMAANLHAPRSTRH